MEKEDTTGLQCITGWSSTVLRQSRSTDCKVDIQKTVPSVDGNVRPHQSLSHILNGEKNKKTKEMKLL